MTIGRRALLQGSAASVAALALPRAEAAGAGRDSGLPMPPPTDRLPPALPQGDPSRVLLDRGWLFHEGDILPPPLGTHDDTYLSVKAGNARGAAAIDFDDDAWQAVTLPHDWASAQPFVESANVSQGYRPRGIGWYRRALRLDEADRGKRIEIQFGGIATNATIWVNGSVVAHNWSGYNSVYVDMTPFARFGDAINVIAVRVDAQAMEGWWYEGAGLYRHVWLARRASVSIATDGVHCDPRANGDGSWRVPVAVTLESIADAATAVTVEAVLIDAAGRTVARGEVDARVASLDRAQAMLTLAAGRPALWSIERPTLYTVVTRVLRDGAPVDERRVAIGFRTVRFDADRGAFLNDRPVKLKGVCLHQDHAGVGTAMPDALVAWRLERLKAMGCNAIRCSHNAPAPEFLDLCDRMGFLVMDENRQFDPAPDYMAQLEWMVRRDRNHPSIILWSVFNEEPMQGTAAGVAMVQRMEAAVRRLDDSRPVTAAMNGSFYAPANVSQAIDVMGFNYYQGDYDRFHALNPAKPLTSSEDTSAFATRGAYADDAAAHVIADYDDHAADWGATNRASWREIAKRPFIAGGFAWTGFDYHGEPTPYAWPTISSFFGILDLCGFPKTAFDVRRAQWIDDADVVGLAPHWNWPGREGQPVRLLVTSNAERVAVRLNGKPVGEAAADRIMGNAFSIPYAAGRIEAIAYRSGREVARVMRETVGAPVALRLVPARTVMAGDGEDAQPVTIHAVDAHGRHVPTANLMIELGIAGGAIIGVGNGDPNSHESEKAPRRSLFNGLAQAIVQAPVGKGRLVLTATAPGLRPARLTIDLLAATPRAQWPVAAFAVPVRGWRRSPAQATRPEPTLAPPDGDNNSWAFVEPGTLATAEGDADWWLYRAATTLPESLAKRGGVLSFAGIAGTAELWIDGARVATKTGEAPAPLSATLAPGPARRVIALLVHGQPGRASGMAGPVSLGHIPAKERR